MMTLDVTVVVLSYDRPALLERALRSIDNQTQRPREVIVVDNLSSSSEKVRRVVEGMPSVQLLSCAENLGFTGGMNVGLEAATARYVYLTEDDIELAPECLEELIGYLETEPDAVLAGPVMWNIKTPTIRCAGGDFSFGSVFTMSVTGVNESVPPSASPFATGFLPGSMIAARTTQLRELGGFHSDFFMYREDVELCARVLARGRHIAIVPGARVYHHDLRRKGRILPSSRITSTRTSARCICCTPLSHAAVVFHPLCADRWYATGVGQPEHAVVMAESLELGRAPLAAVACRAMEGYA